MGERCFRGRRQEEGDDSPPPVEVEVEVAVGVIVGEDSVIIFLKLCVCF
jgi:hypothetical protein